MVLGVADLVSSALCLALAHWLHSKLGFSGVVPVVIVGLPLLPLGAAGLVANRQPIGTLRARARLQSVFNLAYAGLMCVMAATVHTNRTGAGTLWVVAVAVLAIAAFEWRLAR